MYSNQRDGIVSCSMQPKGQHLCWCIEMLCFSLAREKSRPAWLSWGLGSSGWCKARSLASRCAGHPTAKIGPNMGWWIHLLPQNGIPWVLTQPRPGAGPQLILSWFGVCQKAKRPISAGSHVDPFPCLMRRFFFWDGPWDCQRGFGRGRVGNRKPYELLAECSARTIGMPSGGFMVRGGFELPDLPLLRSLCSWTGPCTKHGMEFDHLDASIFLAQDDSLSLSRWFETGLREFPLSAV